MSELPLSPAVCLDKIAVGTNFKDSALISSPNPGIILSHTASVASGVSIQTPHPTKAVLPDYVTPLEMKTTTEMALACAGMTRREANEVVKALLPVYEQALTTAPIGKSYTECFNLDTGRAKKEALDFVEKVKTGLSRLGLPL